jgi:tRNA(Ile2) C34 agmatinyltransferase TiaS
MAATATAAICEEQVSVQRERRPCAHPGGVTLGQLLARAHEAVQAGAATGCPVCGRTLEAHGRECRCDHCGTRLI